MDSVTQALLGATIAASVAPKNHRKKALLTGAVLGTLPDLDVFLKYSSDLDDFTHHRGFSHSLLVLPIFSLFLLPFLKKIFNPISNIRLYMLILLSLITHPLLDALTPYGTQLFYPFNFTPTYISSIFIIDPLYTSWLFLGAIAYLISSKLKWVNSLTLGISTIYLIFGLYMQGLAKENLVKTYPNTTKEGWFVAAMTGSPFCWRGVYVNESSYIESAFNILNPDDKIEAKYNILSSSEYEKSNEVNTLLWFNPDTVFRKYKNKVVSSDLRMGDFGNYVFEFAVSPKNIAGQRLENGNLWAVESNNEAFRKYISENRNLSFPKQKLSQFVRCLGGKY